MFSNIALLSVNCNRQLVPGVEPEKAQTPLNCLNVNDNNVRRAMTYIFIFPSLYENLDLLKVSNTHNLTI